MKPNRLLIVSLALSFVIAATIRATHATPARPGATITVNSTVDIINPADGRCTLREAIIAANSDIASGLVPGECAAGSGADTIILPAGIYTLTIGGSGEDLAATGDLDITGDLTISGAGAASTIIDGGGIDRVFQIIGAISVNISGVTVRNGNPGASAIGGGISNGGALTLNNSTVISNTSYDGSGIYNSGTLTLTSQATIRANVAANSGSGIFNDVSGAVTIIGSSVISNTSLNGSAGGISNAGSMTLINSSVISNTSGGSGGGIGNAGTLSLSYSTVMSNTANGVGGGIGSSGTVMMSHSTIAGNRADNGGGLYNSGTMTLTTNITVSANAGLYAGGGIFNDSGGMLTLSNSAVISNTTGGAAGGVANKGRITLSNITVHANRAEGSGGGVGNETTMTLTNVTVSNNTSDTGTGSGVYNVSGTLTLKNTLVADNTGNNCSGSMTSAGHNLDSSNTCGFNTALGDLVNTNPLLGPLQDNGGATLTRALLPGSPAIDAGDNSGCPATDQRGVSRPQGLRCDIGAYEAAAASFMLYLPLIKR